MIRLTSQELPLLTLTRNDVLIKLPDYTKSNIRVRESGIAISTLDAEKYHPTHGEIVAKSKGAGQSQIGDIAFFNYLLYSAAFIRGTGKQPGMNEGKNYGYTEINKIYLEVDEKPYLIIPETDVDFVFRRVMVDEEIVMFNDNYLLEPKPLKLVKSETIKGLPLVTFKETLSNIFQPHLDKVNFDKNRVFVYMTPDNSPLAKGDEVYMLNNCFIKPEFDYNNPLLKTELFIVKKKNIIALRKEGQVPAVQPIHL